MEWYSQNWWNKEAFSLFVLDEEAYSQYSWIFSILVGREGCSRYLSDKEGILNIGETGKRFPVLVGQGRLCLIMVGQRSVFPRLV